MKVIDNPSAPRYTTVERLDVPNFICMRIEEGEFEGVVFHYENLKISIIYSRSILKRYFL